MSNRFYTSFSLSCGPVLLQGPEAHHLAVVCRFRAGDAVTLFNGDGREYLAEVQNIERKSILLNVVEVRTPDRELKFRLEIAVALPKGDRVDFLVEKLTELGVTDLVPLKTAWSVVYPREAKLERLQRTVIEASKQCGRNVLMQVHPVMAWSDYCQRQALPERKIIAVPGATEHFVKREADTAIAIGPEGGFAPDEMTLAQLSNWHAVSLGPRVLRIETAALALAAQAVG